MRWSVTLATLFATSFLFAVEQGRAGGIYDPGASDTEIKIGQTMAYSGPISAFGVFGGVQAAYFDMLNARGGINGRKINFISRDDGGNPARTVEVTRKLVEDDQVLFLIGSSGTANNSAVQRYLNAKQVPQLFIGSGASKWGNYKEYPWSMGWAPDYATEATIYAQYILANLPDAKIAILYQNDDFGKDLISGMRAGLGERADKMIVAQASYEFTDATVDSQIISLQASGATVFLNAATPKFAAQAIRKAADIGWHPQQFVAFVSNSIGAVLTPAGIEKSVGLISIQFLKDASDPKWADDPGMKQYLSFLKEHFSKANPNDFIVAYGFTQIQTAEQMLKQAGNELTHANVMRQASNLKNLELPLLLPGIKINTTPTDYYPIRQAQLSRFNGKSWELIGGVLGPSR
ncbi:MAG: ABC transporter substrate-binding protein [Xanthobacteraceae bacterium]